MAGEAWPDNPRHVVPQPWHEFVRMWGACQGGMGGVAHWPDAGGVGDQAAWVVEAFAHLGGLLEKVRHIGPQVSAGIF